jgi:4-diphosphocytidyl-2-C-methyl-D-erythritol kinase|nr:MAG: 4-diphosphocytidyl-2-C-methyl-D-erythritol kinase [Bacteroidota bacterium]
MIIEERAPAKINVGLHVLRRRPDGYHDIDTVLVPVAWEDRLLLEAPAEEVHFTCTDPGLEGAHNLCLRALELVQRAGRWSGGLRIRLEKHLPYGAGLGGGSSDAAAVLRGLRRLGLEAAEEELQDWAAQLGSDVPFFLKHLPARARGRGEILEYWPDLIWPFWTVIVFPGIRISTAEAYRWVQPRAEGRADLGFLVRSLDPERWRRQLQNDFEPVVLARFLELRDLHHRLYALGARYVSLSGSGSALWAVFETEGEARSALDALGLRQGMISPPRFRWGP